MTAVVVSAPNSSLPAQKALELVATYLPYGDKKPQPYSPRFYLLHLLVAGGPSRLVFIQSLLVLPPANLFLQEHDCSVRAF